MQWLLLVVTFIVSAALERLARAIGGPIVPVEARATLSLGLVLIAAYVGGSLARRLKLPRLVGYLIAGFVAGPAWFNIIQRDELQVLSVIGTGALSLIALEVGSRLRLDAFRGAARVPLLRAIGGTTAMPFLVVALVTLTVSPWFPLTAHQPFRDALAVALVLGSFAAVASPTVTWALIRDLDARGPVSRSMVNVTTAQTVAAAIFMVVVLAIARPLASRGAVVPGSGVRALLVLAASIGVGAALGIALTQYLRVIRVTWAVLGFAFLISQIARLTGLEAVLMGLAAGCTVRYTAPALAERLDVELERCAVPVYVVFFALAGAGLRFDSLEELGLWPWAILLVALRLNALRWGFQLAGRLGGEQSPDSAALGDYGWLGLVSQGGMAVTLAAVLRGAFPEWNVSLEALLVAMIGFHEAIGPICLQWALRRAGEVTEARGRGGREDSDVPETALVVDSADVVSRV